MVSVAISAPPERCVAALQSSRRHGGGAHGARAGAGGASASSAAAAAGGNGGAGAGGASASSSSSAAAAGGGGNGGNGGNGGGGGNGGASVAAHVEVLEDNGDVQVTGVEGCVCVLSVCVDGCVLKGVCEGCSGGSGGCCSTVNGR